MWFKVNSQVENNPWSTLSDTLRYKLLCKLVFKVLKPTEGKFKKIFFFTEM